MKNIIGIDVGTTEIKCSLLAEDDVLYEERRWTPPLKTEFLNPESVTFTPAHIWDSVLDMLLQAVNKCVPHDFVISVVCQAPSICIWNDNGYSEGVSYLSFYGDPTCNSKDERWVKTRNRIVVAEQLLPPTGSVKISGLTGYIVYMLTGILTMDAVTAWELGIESADDEKNWRHIGKRYEYAEIYPPLSTFSLSCEKISGVNGTVITGTTDSAVLPLSVNPKFQDYYVYLGTWGSLLHSKLRCYSDYNIKYHSGMVNSWIISIPDFIKRLNNDASILESFFIDISMKTETGCGIALCGGLTKAITTQIIDLSKKHLGKRRTIIVPKENSAIGACNLGRILTNGVEE